MIMSHLPAKEPFDTTDTAQQRWLEHTRRQIEASAPAFNEASNWQRLSARLEAEAEWQRRLPAKHSTLFPSWWRALVAYGLGVATAAVVAVGVFPLVTPRGIDVEPLGEVATTSETAELRVVFRDDATVAQIRAALVPIGAVTVGGPGPLGVWRLAVPTHQAAAAKQALSDNAIVDSVSE